MNPWPKHPVIYEINTWVWLQALSQEYKRPVTLATVPREKWDEIADLKAVAVSPGCGFDVVGLNFQNSQIGLRVDPLAAGMKRAAVRKAN